MAREAPPVKISTGIPQPFADPTRRDEGILYPKR